MREVIELDSSRRRRRSCDLSIQFLCAPRMNTAIVKFEGGGLVLKARRETEICVQTSITGVQSKGLI